MADALTSKLNPLASEMRTTLDIDEDLLKRLRLEAHRLGVPLKHLLNATLRRGLAEPSESRPRTRYRCPTFSLGPPRPGLNLDKALALAAALEDDALTMELDPRK